MNDNAKFFLLAAFQDGAVKQYGPFVFPEQVNAEQKKIRKLFPNAAFYVLVNHDSNLFVQPF